MTEGHLFAPAEPDAPTAAKLSKLVGLLILLIDGGLRVKETDTHYIDVCRMLVNWRLVTVPKDSPMTRDREWCYFGTGAGTLLRAVAAAIDWDGADDTEPAGWGKNATTGEYRK